MGIKNEFNIDKLLEPYKETGDPKSPIKRSLTTIASALIYKNRIPPDIAGAATFAVFHKMSAEGLEFKGDGTQGSPGAQLYSCIKGIAARMAEEQAVEAVLKEMNILNICLERDCPKRVKMLKKRTRWDRFVSFIFRPRGIWRI